MTVVLLDAKSVLGDESTSTMIDFLADPDSLGDQEYRLDEDDRNMLFKHIDKLDRRSAKVIRMRFGLRWLSANTPTWIWPRPEGVFPENEQDRSNYALFVN